MRIAPKQDEASTKRGAGVGVVQSVVETRCDTIHQAPASRCGAGVGVVVCIYYNYGGSRFPASAFFYFIHNNKTVKGRE
jgi:hypothetical protein